MLADNLSHLVELGQRFGLRSAGHGAAYGNECKTERNKFGHHFLWMSFQTALGSGRRAAQPSVSCFPLAAIT
jgi:hypothetical protein